ncbi:MAG: OsmC family protein [Prolixibacteraceae bacterium]
MIFEYKITATVQTGGKAKADANKTEVSFDATSGRDDTLPNPAELLLTSVAACMLKNVQRYSEILKIEYRSAKITVEGKRNENPPYMKEISYKLEIDTDAGGNKIKNWHKNILKYGTITNTVNRACKFEGEMIKQKIE